MAFLQSQIRISDSDDVRFCLRDVGRASHSRCKINSASIQELSSLSNFLSPLRENRTFNFHFLSLPPFNVCLFSAVKPPEDSSISLSREEQNRHLADIDSPNNTGTISRRCSGKRIMTIGRESRDFAIIVMLYLSPFERLAHQGFVRGSRSDPRSLLSLRGA